MISRISSTTQPAKFIVAHSTCHMIALLKIANYLKEKKRHQIFRLMLCILDNVEYPLSEFSFIIPFPDFFHKLFWDGQYGYKDNKLQFHRNHKPQFYQILNLILIFLNILGLHITVTWDLLLLNHCLKSLYTFKMFRLIHYFKLFLMLK